MNHKANNNYRHRWYMDSELVERNGRIVKSFFIECIDCDIFLRDDEIIDIIDKCYNEYMDRN